MQVFTVLLADARVVELVYICKVMLQGTICNDVTQHYNIVPTLFRCVALITVVANRLVYRRETSPLDKERCFMLLITDCRGEVSLRGKGKGNFARARRFPFTTSSGAPCALSFYSAV